MFERNKNGMFDE
jgi:hypothetical protein